MDAISLFAKHFVQTRFEDLPREVVEVTKKEVLDLLGVTLAGFTAPGIRELYQLITDWGGKEESTVIYSKRKVPAPMAAQMNAAMGHALDFDDVHDPAVLHPGVVAIPTGMAVGERRGKVNGKEFITAAALGVDMMSRMALAVWPGYDPSRPDEGKKDFQAQRVKQGWHLTAVTGYFAAAGVAGKLLGFDEEQLVNAFGIAYHECGGNLQCRTDGAHTKRMGPGFASRAGIASALMAQKRVIGARNSLQGEHGLYPLYFRGGYDAGTLTADLGSHFEGVNVSIKPYPCCRGIHVFIDGALALRKEHQIRVQDVKEINVFSDEGGYNALCMPFEARIRPRTPVDSQFSIPWGVATALSKGCAAMEHFTEAAIKDPDILEVAGKVSAELDHSLDRLDRTPPAKIRILMKSGETYSVQVDDPLGSPGRPMSFDDCIRKFRDCATSVPNRLPDERLEKIIDLIGQLEQVNDVGKIMTLLS